MSLEVKIVQFYAIYMLEIRRKRMGKTCQGSGFIAIRQMQIDAVSPR